MISLVGKNIYSRPLCLEFLSKEIMRPFHAEFGYGYVRCLLIAIIQNLKYTVDCARFHKAQEKVTIRRIRLLKHAV